MFSDKFALTKAVLAGRKTHTRRAIKLKVGEYVKVVALDNGSFMSYVAKEGNPTAHVGAIEMPDYVRPLTPKYFIGEEVAIAQSYFDCGTKWAREHIDIASDLIKRSGYRNKMFVKAHLMPHRIKITNIRIERLQDISDEDCLKEGVSKIPLVGDYTFEIDKVLDSSRWTAYRTPRAAFAVLIDKVSGKGTWESNPYVFVYEFELVK